MYMQVRQYAWMILAPIILIAGYWLVLLPQLTLLTSLHTEENDMQITLAKKRNAIEHHQNIQEGIGSEALTDLVQQLEQQGWLVKKAVHLNSDHRMQFVLWGEYTQLLRLVSLLKSQQWVYAIEDYQLKVQKHQYASITLDVVATVRADQQQYAPAMYAGMSPFCDLSMRVVSHPVGQIASISLYSLNQLHFLGYFKIGQRASVLLQAPDGKTFRAQMGDTIARENAEVTEINSTSLSCVLADGQACQIVMERGA